MNCRKVSRKLSAYIDDDLSGNEKSRVEDHLKVCSACRRKAADFKLILETAGQLERVKPGPYFVNRVLCAANQKKGPAEILSIWRYRLTLSGVAFVVAASLTFFIVGPPASMIAVQPVAPVGVQAHTSPDTNAATSENGFPVSPEALERDMALTNTINPDSLNGDSVSLPRHYVQPVSIKRAQRDSVVF